MHAAGPQAGPSARSAAGQDAVAPALDGFGRDVERALALVTARSSDAAADGLADPDALGAMLSRAQSGDAVLVRACTPLEQAEGDDARFAPNGAVPAWLSIRMGSRDVDMAPYRSVDGSSTARRATVQRVVLESEEARCCNNASCTRRMVHVTVWLVLGDDRLLVVETIAEPQQAVPRAHRAAKALSRVLGVAYETGDEELEDLRETTGAGGPPPPKAAEAIEAAALAQFALRLEGDRLVLRDHVSHGPRATAPRNLAIAAVLFVIALAPWVRTAVAIAQGQTVVALGYGALGALATLTAYAFFGVSRFSARYAAASFPVMALGDGKLVVHPWTSRSGAVDRRHEGRFGAAIPLGEVHGAAVRARGDFFAVELDTDHGAIDLLASVREEAAAWWCGVLLRVFADATHPAARPSARQRARAKSRADAARADPAPGR